MRLADVLPEFADELANGLASMGHHHLAEAVYAIEIAERCLCVEPGCVTFYAMPKSSAPSGPACESIVGPAEGVLCVQYVDRQIIWVEALGRPEDRVKLDQFNMQSHPTAKSANQAVNGRRR